jgi:hypothetical protein
LFSVTEQGLDCSKARPATKSQVRCWMTTHSYRFQGKEVDSSASSALTSQDADDFMQSPFVTEFMPVEFEDVEFRDVPETGRHLGVCSDDPEQAARVGRASAAGPAPNLS